MLKRKVSCAQIVWVQNYCDDRQHLCVRTFSCTLWTIQRRQADLLWQTDTWSFSWQRFPAVCRQEQKSSLGQNDAKSPTNLHSRWSKILPLNSPIIFSEESKRFSIIIHWTDFVQDGNVSMKVLGGVRYKIHYWRNINQ